MEYADVAKSTKDRDRRALVEQMRKEQEARERRRTLLVLVGSLVVGALIIGLAVWKAWPEEKVSLADIGVAKSAASCQPVKTKKAEGNNDHVASGVHVDYKDAPPAFGTHDGNFLTGSEIKNQYSVADRPPVERLVHSLEHGYTLVWYDETAGGDAAEKQALDEVADQYPLGDKVMVVPWTSDDGDAFPGGAHVALTHWTGDPNQGVWEYCGKVSGEAVQDFVAKYPADNAPEPGSA